MVPKIRSFSQPTRSARAVAHPPNTGVRARRARRVRAPPPRAGRRAPNAPPSPSSPCPLLRHRARFPLVAAVQAPSAHASRVGGRAGPPPSRPTTTVCASCPPAAPRPSPLLPQPLRCVLHPHPPPLAPAPARPRPPPIGPSPHRARACATPRDGSNPNEAPAQSGGGLNARRLHPVHALHTTRTAAAHAHA